MILFMRKLGAMYVTVAIISACIIVAALYFVILYLPMGQVKYSLTANVASSTDISLLFATSTATTTPDVPPPFVVTHVMTPEPVKAAYYSSWAAGSNKFRKEMFNIVEKTEVNAVVIDIKDYTGRISYFVDDPYLQEFKASERRIPDIKEFIGELHKRGVYVIGRISCFQDSFLIKGHPEWAVKTNEGTIWQDFHGVKWLDAGAKPVWEYLTAIGKDAYAQGFDELNFDYTRFPSDGNLRDISYTWSIGKKRTDVLRSFWGYLHDQFASSSIPISADLFGLVTTAEDDLGIGQNLEDALPNFDFVAPMVYPSHFGTGYMGFPKPAKEPYKVVKYTMTHASNRAVIATSTPNKLRPWLQAFDLGAIYTPAMVRSQIQATYDAGLTSWMLWNAASVYNMDALAPKGATTTLTGQEL